MSGRSVVERCDILVSRWSAVTACRSLQKLRFTHAVRPLLRAVAGGHHCFYKQTSYALLMLYIGYRNSFSIEYYAAILCARIEPRGDVIFVMLRNHMVVHMWNLTMNNKSNS